MLSKSEVHSLFREHVPDEVLIVWVDPETYINRAMQHPFIQAQMDIGIYNEENIFTDFLSPACSYTQAGRLELCYDLLAASAEGVDEELTRAYLTMMALHEAHHFHVNAQPQNAQAHGHSELECIAATAASNPEVEALSQEFENVSPVFQRVYARIADIQRERITT